MPDYKYLKLKRKDYRLWDPRDINAACPKCGISDIEMVWATVQFGTSAHYCTLYAYCKACGHHFAWQEWIRRSRETVSTWLKNFSDKAVKNVNE